MLGLTTPGVAMWVSAARLGGLRFGSVTEAAARWLPVLRDRERVDLAIGLFHSGLDGGYGREAALRNGLPLSNGAGRAADTVAGFDLIVSGQAHRLSPYEETGGESDYGTPVVEAGSRGNGVALVTFSMLRRGGRWLSVSLTRRTLRAEADPDPAFLALAHEDLEATRAWLDEPTAARFRAVPNKREFHRCAGGRVRTHSTARVGARYACASQVVRGGVARQWPYDRVRPGCRIERGARRVRRRRPRSRWF